MKYFIVFLCALLPAGSAMAQEASGDSARALSSAPAEAPSGKLLLRRIDRNLLVDQAISRATMIIHGRTGRRAITSRSWIRGQDSVYVEYLSPARERGKKMLRLGDKLWTYTPEPNDRIITISGHLLRQSLMGSDLSYEDMMENHSLDEKYQATVVGLEQIDDRPCWVVQLLAKVEDVAYHSRRIWVDAERWLPLQGERYAKSGKLLKTTRIVEVFYAGDRWYPKKMIFKDALSRGEGTEYIIESIDFDVQIPDHKLSKAALRE
ncbi:outer membrane lipoprotein-sorting protein [Candidatus Zixiibacteriota bacterium]